MISPYTLAALGIAGLYLLLLAVLRYTQDVREPPAIATQVPFISPILGMIRYKSGFYTRMRDIYGCPIYTLRFPGKRIYVVNATTLIPVVQRQFRTIAFSPIAAKAAADGMGASKLANEIISQNMTGDDGYLMSFDKAIHPAVSPGAKLDAMNRASIEFVADRLEKLRQSGPATVKLFEWVRHEIVLATTQAVYGPKNPFSDVTVEMAWYTFEKGLMVLLLKLFPTLLAKPGLQAREYIHKKFEKYFGEGAHEEGSALVKARYEHNVDHGVPLSDIARCEIGGAFALLSNTSPAAFWVIYHLYSDSKVLEDCRRELSHVVEQEGNVCKVDLSDIKASCPTLLLTLQEALRFHGVGISTRIVLEDHMLDNRYLLKKGSILMIPAPVQHNLSSVWGANVDEFDHRRFLRSSHGKRPNPVAFRGFGGGTVLCPGRHFVSTEILAFAALLILQFDVRPVNGRWSCPKTDNAEMWATIPSPDDDIDVEISTRDDRSLVVSFSGSDKAMEIAAEDIPAD